MAGERIGKTYEALLRVVLDSLKAQQVFEGEVFWNETPAELSVEPDFLIGTDKNHPSIIIMVTHSGSSKNSDMKCWRNLGELCEAKASLSPMPFALNIVFDAVMKENLKALQNAAFDRQIIVGDFDYGPALGTWVQNNEVNLPTDQNEKAMAIKEITKADPNLSKMLSFLERDVKNNLSTMDPDLQQLWDFEQKRKHGTAPIARNTYLRRGFSKRLLVGDALRSSKINNSDGLWLSRIGIAAKGIGGYRIIDSELLWFLSTEFAQRFSQIAEPCISEGFKKQISRVRSLVLISEYEKYVLNNYDRLITIDGMRECLRSQHTDPAIGIELPEDIPSPENMWIYDFIAALSKAAAKRAQAFGYSYFSTHPDGRKSRVGNMLLGRWCTSFICEYFNRKQVFTLPKEAENFVAKVLSEQLANYPKTQIASLSSDITAKFIAKEYEAVLLAHRGFEPLLALLIDKNIVKSSNNKVSIRTCFSEKAGLSGQAGKTTVAKVKNTIINWQTATNSGRDHKRKELCGRAVGLRYTWDSEKAQFMPRPGVEKLILLLDGTWKQKDLNALIRAGWDEIYYPDEIDKLKSAII